MSNVAFVVGARPNFMKIAPILRAMAGYSRVQSFLIHTGQHYDAQLSDVFFEELNIKRPDICLNVGSGSHGAQTARIIEGIERLLSPDSELPTIDRIVVVGDVNSTLAASIAASKLHIPVAHVEAGLRSFDRSMPEEINRVVTDSIADLLLVSEPAGVKNLVREGHRQETIHLVGNVMIDTLVDQLDRANRLNALEQHGVASGEYVVVTLHRPANVDDPDTLRHLVSAIADLSERIDIVFPVHPRTKKKLQEFGLLSQLESLGGLRMLNPLGYQEFLALTSNAKFIVTDSGGLQEESTYLGVPCLTMRPNTERPITVELGSSTIIGSNVELLRQKAAEVLDGEYKQSVCPELWDGRASERIARIIATSVGAGPVLTDSFVNGSVGSRETAASEAR